MMKRMLDIGFSLVAIIFLLPLWILLSLCIFLEDPGPIFYRQKRLGKNGQLFTLYKFRSMRQNNIPPLTLGAVKHNHALVTRVGYVIRRFKLDETPQFCQVLMGDMSLVGPRPCLPERIQTMSQLEKNRLAVAPGLTGWAEVNGNVELTWEEQVLLDLWYVTHQSFALDLKIIARTVWVVFFGSQKNAVALANCQQEIPFNFVSTPSPQPGEGVLSHCVPTG